MNVDARFISSVWHIQKENRALRTTLQAVIDAHETGRFEPLQAAIEIARQVLAKGESK